MLEYPAKLEATEISPETISKKAELGPKDVPPQKLERTPGKGT